MKIPFLSRLLEIKEAQLALERAQFHILNLILENLKLQRGCKKHGNN